MNKHANIDDYLAVNRRHFFKSAMAGVGGMALNSLIGESFGANVESTVSHFAPKAKRVIYLFLSGGPAQQDLFDYKPLLAEKNNQQLPPEVRGSQRLTGMSSNKRPSHSLDHSSNLLNMVSLERGSASCCPTTGILRMIFVSSSQCTQMRSIMIQHSHFFRPAHRLLAGRRWGHGCPMDLAQ